MNIEEMIAQLEEEGKRIAQAIDALKRVAVSAPPRRGRPPKWKQAAKPEEK